MILGNGSDEVIEFIVRSYCLSGDAIVTQQAAFIAYKICAQIHGVRTLEVPVDSSFHYQWEEIAATVRADDRAKVVFLANPNNPTGNYLRTEELRGLLKELAQIRGGSTLVVLDCAYREYVTATDCPDGMDLIQEYPNLIILGTFSKIFGLAGLRVGYGVASHEVVSHLEKVRQPFNLNSLALAGAGAALSDRIFIRESRQINVKGMKFWEKQLENAGIPYWKSQGNFILVDVQKGLGKSGPEVYQDCLTRGVIFRPIANYGFTNALRISIGTPGENERAVEVLCPSLRGSGRRRVTSAKNKG